MTARRNPDVTRENLLNAATAEIRRHGFQAASLDRIIAAAGVTKGALYHHFASKKELGYAVVDEAIRQHVVDAWIRPLADTDDPIRTILDLMSDKLGEMGKEDVILGCPLNSIAQEMAPLDEGFRERTERLFQLWISGTSQALARGQKAGTVKKNVNPDKVARFMIAAIEGSLCMAKNAQCLEVLKQNMVGLREYLEGIQISRVVS
ncbi:MAG: TetR/AcrR family transcriptional regulator [Candidatus Krumholzibacteriota bacterium]|nr:TetR/AcrR family transcriptional regulator [Candidatus Krumholzibacteriota bacterium]